jgi:thiol-disulfide isomerase/thioredoxin/5-hydroxyisourate hydrolase-like protein (transthyretin family)
MSRGLWVWGLFSFALIFCSLAAAQLLAEDSSSPNPPAEFRWNEALTGWRVAGPIAKVDRFADELDRVLPPNEATLDANQPLVVAGKTLEWKPSLGAMVNFIRALGLEGDRGRYAIAYAWTEFQSDADQDVLLCVSNDDGVVVWLNGSEVYRNAENTSSYLDQGTIKVSLKHGRNTLLAKVGQTYGDWEFGARLRPIGYNEPLFSISCLGASSGDTPRLPVLEVELLDADGTKIDMLHLTGGRVKPSGYRYTAYGPEAQPAPTNVRLHFNEPGFAAVDETRSWDDLKAGKVSVTLTSTEPLRGQFVDAATAAPIQGAKFREGDTERWEQTGDDGRFEFKHYDPLVSSMTVVAAGYEPREVRIDWPPKDDWTIKLSPGGHVLRGRVVTSDGGPIAGANISVSGSSYDGATQCDADGRFEIIGIRGNVTELYPVVSAPGYIAKDGFTLALKSSASTDVEWRLDKGATVSGTVTAKADGRPVAGVTVVAGSDRFSSNRANPESKTDDQGRYELTSVKPGPAFINAFSDDFAPASQTVTVSIDKAATADFQLEPGADVTGRVVDASGNPVADVWVITDMWNGARMFRRELHTGADGTYRLPHMPLTPTKTEFLKQGYVNVRGKELLGGQSCNVVLAPVANHVIRVKLSDSDQPPKEVTLQQGYKWQGREEISWQDSQRYDRSIKYDPLAGVVRIRVDEPYEAKLFWRIRAAGYKDAVIAQPDDLTAPLPAEVTLERFQTITGRVVDADTGQPAAGVLVALVNPQDRMRLDYFVDFAANGRALDEFTGIHTTTGADGTFELPAQSGGKSADLLLIRKDDTFHYIINASSVLSGTAPELPLPTGGDVSGQVLVAGKPAADEEVHITWIAPGEQRDSFNSPFGFGGQVTTDVDGRFQFKGLGPGRYQLARVRSFKSPLGGGSMSMYLTGEDVVVLPGAKVTHDFVQPAGHKISGQTVGAKGEPAANCVVSVFRGGDQRERIDGVRTDDEGRFTVENLADGTYLLSAEQYDPSAAGCGIGTRGATGSMTVKVSADTTATIKLSSPAQVATSGASGKPSLAGSVPPDFTGKLLDRDEKFSLSDQYGKVVAVDFWATWCGPCMVILPETKEVYEKYKDNPDVAFVSVSLDQEPDALRTTIHDRDIEFPVIYESRDQSQQIASAFGVTGIPTSFVIGRDGRFAADGMHGSQLGAALEAALKVPADPAMLAGGKPARLTVKLSLDDAASGVPGAEISLKALDTSGKVVREETIHTPGQATQFVWLYPPLADGGEIRVAASAPGCSGQEQIVSQPDAVSEVSFAFASPRTISGQVSVDSGAAPGAGAKVNVYRNDGLRKTATADADGKFSTRVLPGSYYVSFEGTDSFAPDIRERNQVEVPDDADPAPITLNACPTVTLTGTVNGENGQPVEGAEVRSASNAKTVRTDATGHFELPGVPSRGPAAIIAIKRPAFAQLTLTDFDGKEPQTLSLGKQSAGGDATLSGKMPKLPASPLVGGDSVDWRPGGEGDTLVAFVSLWHPKANEFLRRAAKWADDNHTRLTVVSTDWSLEEARRQWAKLDAKPAGVADPLYAGPGGLTLTKDWKLASPTQAYVVSSTGNVTRSLPTDQLPQ